MWINQFLPSLNQQVEPGLATKLKGLAPMKTIVVDNVKKDTMTKRYLTEDPSKTHTKEELEALHRAIRFTHAFKHEESMAKMDEEEIIQRPVPKFFGGL